MKWSSFLRTMVVAAATLFSTVVSAQTADSRRVPSQSTGDNPNLSGFIPIEAKLIKELRANLEGRGTNAIVLAYGFDRVPYVTVGVRILKHGPSGWEMAFEESDSVINGAGVSDALNIEKVSSSEGKEGVVVILKNSGAGTATDWHILASVRSKVIKVESAQIRNKVLKDRGYVFEGYNGVSVSDDLVTEDLAGYSPETARCCPDKPSIAIRSRFTGASIKLDSVKELPSK